VAGEFYPPGAAQLGIPLERTVVVRPESPTVALWVWEQSLRCPGSAVTCGWIEALDDRLFRRLQLAAETGGGLGFLLRRPDCRSAPSWAAARMLVRPMRAASDTPEWRFQVSLARGRNGAAEAAVDVELSGE
jgi:protein ImuA